MLKGFREFAFRGNVIDLAVAVVIGAAFTALVGVFTDALIKPIIGIFLGGGVSAGTIEIRGQIIDFTAMINAIITFLITIAVIYFIFVAPMNKFRERLAQGKASAEEEAAATAEDIALLTEIRDLLKTRSQ
mgnify:CR=1 FL=1